MRYRVTHDTVFNYQTSVIAAHHVLRLKPMHTAGSQKLLQHALDISHPEADLLEYEDYFGNSIYELRLNTRHDALTITSVSNVDVQPHDEVLLDLSPAWEYAETLCRVPTSAEQWHAAQYCFPSTHVRPDTIGTEFDFLFQEGKPVLRLANDVCEYIYNNFAYESGVTDIATPNDEVVRMRRGVCQDFAHLAIAVLRRHGLAARYVSGYILSQFDSRPALVGSEASHAWISVYCPDLGWMDYDPTNNQMTSDQHIVVAWGRDYADVSPTRGSIMGGGAQTIQVGVSVIPHDRLERNTQ